VLTNLAAFGAIRLPALALKRLVLAVLESLTMVWIAFHQLQLLSQTERNAQVVRVVW